MHIVVCDDLREERTKLIDLILLFTTSQNIKTEFSEYSSGEELLSEFVADKFALIFLDIYMDGISGMETARKLKDIDPNCVIIFTTTSLEHGAEAFEVEAFHYLVKPVQKEKLFKVLEKWYDKVCSARTITLKYGRTVKEIFVSDIYYIEVMGRSCIVHTVSEKLTVSHSLSALEDMLPASEFIRPIRYCLVALSYIKSVSTDTLILKNGEQVPISRLERENTKQQLASYRLQQLRRR